MSRYIYNISGFVDFCEYHMDGTPIYIVNGRLYGGFNMLIGIHYYYNFTFASTKTEIEDAIQRNMYMFDVLETIAFYYPNDNMFSCDNSEYGVKGYVLTIKEKYRFGRK